MKNIKCCLIYNFAQHYRSAVFKALDLKLGMHFYFGDFLDRASDVREMDLKQLNGFQRKLRNRRLFRKFIWQSGAIWTLFKGYKFFFLYGDATFLSNWIILFLSKISGKKTYLWTHGLTKDLSWKGKLFIYPFYNLADGLLLYSDYSRNRMIEAGFPSEKLFCIYNSLDHKYQISVRARLGNTDIYKAHFQNDDPVIIYIGRIQKSKKLNLLFEAMSKLIIRDRQCNLVIVGDDKEGTGLKELALDLGLENNTWFYGPTYNEDEIGNLIFNADVCVSPGNVGLTAMHSLVYGTPVITHSNFKNQGPEFEVIVPGVNGDFFKEDSSIDLAEKIDSWIGLDQKTRSQVRQAGYRVIDTKYNPDYQVRVLKDIISDQVV